MKHYVFVVLMLGFSGCGKISENKDDQSEIKSIRYDLDKRFLMERPKAIDDGKFFDKEGKRMLYGGERESQHFDITDHSLKEDQYHYGIGREHFPALLDPEFISVEEADLIWADTSRFLLAYTDKEAKAYSVEDMTRHEIVNDFLNGKPIMAAYCILADLGGVFEREYAGEVLNFALSGYTYYDDEVWDGFDGFILWDRETESLWWPLIGKAVSGPLKDVNLIELDKNNWVDTNWVYVKKNFPNAMVLKSDQDFDRPEEWRTIEDVSMIRKNFILDD